MAKKTSRRRSILIAFASVIVGLAILDLAYRGYLTFFRDTMSVVPSAVGRFDPDLGWSLEPNARAVSRRIGEIEYKINSNGLRDDEHDYEKPPGVRRIVVIGDSRTFGFGVPIDKHFTRLLEGYCKDTEVINLGVSGFGVDQELLFLQNEGMKYDPDLVMAYVAHYGAHRHMHTVRFGAEKPKFELADDGLVLTNHPVGTAPSKTAAILSGVLAGISNLFSGGGQPADNRTQKQKDRDNAKDPQFKAELHRLGQAIVLEMMETANNNGAEFLLITPIGRLAKFGQEKDIHVLNPRNALKNSLFKLPGDLKHINESGNGVLAWEIASEIRRLGLIDC